MIAAATIPRAAQLEAGFRRQCMVGGAILAVFFFVFGGWAVFARLDAAVVAPATVSVAGNRQAVQHRDGGIVARIHVGEGQQVETGELLIELEGAELATRERVLASQLIANGAAFGRLEAERLGRDSIQTPAWFAALAEDPAAIEALAGETRQLEARRASFENETAVLRQRIVQLHSQIQGFEALAKSEEMQGVLIDDELSAMRELYESGFATLTRVRALEREAAAIAGRAAEYQASTARTAEQIGEAELQIIQLSRTRQEEVALQLRSVELAISELQPDWSAVKAQLERTRIRAPVSGQVLSLAVHTEGGVIAPGQVLMEIVPENRQLILQARINPQDIEDLRPGARVEVRLTAFARTDAPILYGSLTRVSGDRLVDAATGAPYYMAEIELPASEIDRVRPIRAGASHLAPGMPAEVVIPLTERTALQYILGPLADHFWRSFRES